MPWYKRLNWPAIIVYIAFLILFRVVFDVTTFTEVLYSTFLCLYAALGLTSNETWLKPKAEEPEEPKYDPYDKRIW